MLKKLATVHGKVEFSQIKGSICHIPKETANICNILPKPAVSNRLVVKLRRDLKYRGHVYFEPVCPQIIYHTLAYLKPHNKLYENTSIGKGLSSEDMLGFFDIVEIQGQNRNVTEKNISDREKKKK